MNVSCVDVGDAKSASQDQKTKKDTIRKKQEEVFIGCFVEQLRLGMLTPREAYFAQDIIKRYELYGSLTDKQYECVYKTQMRLIMTREVPFEDENLFP